MNDFNPTDLVLFKLNNYDYVLHKHVIHKMDLFNSLMDESIIIDTINITWKISPENVNIVFHCINDFSYSKLDKNISTESCNEIVSFMKYIGIEFSYIREILKNLLRYTPIVQYMVDCLENKYYDDEFILGTLTDHFYWTKNCLGSRNTDELSEILKILKKLDFSSLSIDIKFSIIRNVISFLSKDIISKCHACDSFGYYARHYTYIKEFYQSYGLVASNIDPQISREYDVIGEYLVAILKQVKINGICTYIYNPKKNNKMHLVEIIIDDIAKLLLNI